MSKKNEPTAVHPLLLPKTYADFSVSWGDDRNTLVLRKPMTPERGLVVEVSRRLSGWEGSLQILVRFGPGESAIILSGVSPSSDPAVVRLWEELEYRAFQAQSNALDLVRARAMEIIVGKT